MKKLFLTTVIAIVFALGILYARAEGRISCGTPQAANHPYCICTMREARNEVRRHAVHRGTPEV